MTNAPEDRRQSFEICAEFEIDGSALVRSGFGDQDQGPDVVHLHTNNRQREDQPVLPGTSIGGALRQRALRIAKTLAGAQRPDSATRFVEEMFGPAEIKSVDRAFASRVSVAESFIIGGHTLVQTRIKIDRFTGATFESALLEEAPHFGGGVTLRVSLRDTPRKSVDAEIGLLLLLLKDLWLADLSLGGESSVGRGRLRGRRATLTLPDRRRVELTADENSGVKLSDPMMEATLNDYVRTLNQHPWQEVK
jgi:CRISPR/Cas system CSM-associated protein Csm3 (group 7 of RAMP superfamily)